MDSVYIIRVKGGKHDGTLVAVVQPPPEGFDLPESEWGGELLRLYVHRAGMRPEAVKNFTVEGCPLIPWASLKGASMPVEPALGTMSRFEAVELVREWCGLSNPRVLRTDAERAAVTKRVDFLKRALRVDYLDDAIEKYGTSYA